MKVALPRDLTIQTGFRAQCQMQSRDFSRIVTRISKLTGIVIQDHKRMMVQTRILDRIRHLGFDNFAAYLDFLEKPEGSAENENFCNALTTNLTSFFREPHHFEHLSLEMRRMENSRPKNLRIWSAGCSTGEEAYSIASLLLRSNVREFVPDTKILATDVDTNVLRVAQNSEYSSSSLQQISKYNLDRLVDVDYENFVFKSEVRDLVAFKKLNLLNNWPMKGLFDVIFCRNVLIYFSTETKAKLIERFFHALKPSGVLYLGHSESILGGHPNLTNEGITIYRKSGEQ